MPDESQRPEESRAAEFGENSGGERVPQRPTALVYRALYLGDLLAAVPALRGIRRALPSHRLVLATDSSLAPLLPLVGGIDELWPVRELQPLDWSGTPPDVAVNLHGRGPQSHRLIERLRPHRLLAFARPELGVDGPPWRAGEHEVHRWCRLVESAWPGLAKTDDLVLARPASPPVEEGAVVVHPGASKPARRWPAERFAAVARRIVSAGLPVVVTGSACETDLATRVCRAAGLPDSAMLAGKTDLDSLAALVASARLVICNDTGVAHLASAYRTPSVVLFGPGSPLEWGPPAHGPHIALWHGEKGTSASPHGSTMDPGLATIQVDEVLRAVATLTPASPLRLGAE